MPKGTCLRGHVLDDVGRTADRACRICKKQYYKDRVESRRQIVKKAKDVSCMDCGVKYPFYVMDFDHVGGIKRHNLSRMKNHSLETLEIEIAKCDVVCANCHRERTYKDMEVTYNG